MRKTAGSSETAPPDTALAIAEHWVRSRCWCQCDAHGKPLEGAVKELAALIERGLAQQRYECSIAIESLPGIGAGGTDRERPLVTRVDAVRAALNARLTDGEVE